MNKRTLPVYQVSGEYAACLEHAFAPGAKTEPGAVSEGTVLVSAQKLGAMGITPLASSNFGRVSEDTVHLSVWVNWGLEKDALFSRLHSCQLESRGHAETVAETDENGLTDEDYSALISMTTDDYGGDTIGARGSDERYMEGHGKGLLEFGGCLWKVLPHGMGGKDGRSYYPYVMMSGGVLVGFRRDSHETVSNMWVEMGSIPLAARGGLANVWDELQGMFAKESVTVVKEIVSRVDVYADFDACDVGEFCRRFTEGMRVSRARKVGHYGEEDLNTATYLTGRRYTGFSLGHNIKLRCYDKALELTKDPVKWAVFAERYGGIPEVLTRVEFQLRRVALKEFLVNGLDRIDGVESYLAARDQLWKYLTEDWFRLTEDAVDAKNNNQSKAETWTVWQTVQSAVGQQEKIIFRHQRPAKVDMEHLFRMALGCMCKMALWERAEVDTVRDVVSHFVEKVKSHGRRYFLDTLERHYDEMRLKIGHFARSGEMPGCVVSIAEPT